MSTDGQQIDAATVDAREFARNVAQTSDAGLRQGMQGPLRPQIIAEIFRRMEEHFKPASASDAVIHLADCRPARQRRGPLGGGDHEPSLHDQSRAERGSARHSDARRSGLPSDRDGECQRADALHERQAEDRGDLMFAAQIPAMFTIPGVAS